MLNFLFKIKRWSTSKKYTVMFLGREITVTSFEFPYKHYLIDDFLSESDYNKIILSLEGVDLDSYKKFYHYAKIYDVWERTVDKTLVNFLYSKDMYDFASLFTSNKLTRKILLMFHLDPIRKEDKFIHTDYSEVAFRKDFEEPDHLTNFKNDKMFGTSKYTDKKISHFIYENNFPLPIDYVYLRRNLAFIYYINNKSEDQGGETGIFVKYNNKYFNVASIKPKNNRVLIFETTKSSYHNYKKCNLPLRHSIICWFHTELKN